MKITSSFFPSFEMQVKTYDPKSSIKLVGENNWWQMLRNYGLIVLFVVTLAIFLKESWPLIGLLPLFFVFIYVFSNSRSPSYLKQEIVFDKYGILLKHSKDLKGSRQIKPDSIRKMYVNIVRNRRIKFSFDDANKSIFEFSSERLSGGKTKFFVQDIAQLLGLDVKNYRQFKKDSVFELVNLASVQTECDLPIKDKCLLYALYVQRVNSDLIISRLGGLKGTKRIFGLTLHDRVLTYQNWYSRKKEIAYKDITKFDYKVSIETNQYSTNVVGRFYAETRTGRIRILSVSRIVAHSQALAQFRMVDDMERLKKILEAELHVGRN